MFADRGPVTNTLKRPVNAIASTFVEACVAMGYKEVDYHDPDTPEGVAHMQSNVRDGQRCSTAVGYLQPAHGTSRCTAGTLLPNFAL